MIKELTDITDFDRKLDQAVAAATLASNATGVTYGVLIVVTPSGERSVEVIAADEVLKR